MSEKTAAEQALAIKETKALDRLQGLTSLDWRKTDPKVLAVLLTTIGFPAKDGMKDYLTPAQAAIFAIRCYELNLSPFSSEVWFDKERSKVNITLEGKKRLARLDGYQYGPPEFERMTRPFQNTSSRSERNAKAAGYKEDVGYKCTMEIKGFSKPATYTAWMSEWHNGNVWTDKAEHMLQTRAQEKAITMSSGVGASEMPSDFDIVPPPAPKLPAGINVEVVEAEYQTIEKEK